MKRLWAVGIALVVALGGAASPVSAKPGGGLWDVYRESLRGAKYIDLIGFPRFGGGLGGYASFVAICPRGTKRGVRVGQLAEAPLRRYASPLHWDAALGMRVR
jgi:hypothetical protein